MIVPWNASWTSEERYEIRPCKYAEGRKALWMPYSPNVGRPIFAKPHMVRQRQSIARFICTVCGKHTPLDDRWWFKLGHMQDGHFITTEAPVHHECGSLGLKLCPHLRGKEADFEEFPMRNLRVLAAMIGAGTTAEDFGVNATPENPIVGHLKFAWPSYMFKPARSAT